MNRTIRSHCKLLMEQLCQHIYAAPFLGPVDAEALNLPDYYAIIRNPMDFGTIQEKIRNKEYADLHQFSEDVRLVFQNCYTYNQSGSNISKMAKKLQNIFESKFESLLKLDSGIAALSEEENSSEGSNLMEDDFKEEEEQILNLEQRRDKNITKNKEMLKELGLDGFIAPFEKAVAASSSGRKRSSPSEKYFQPPTRASKRKKGFQYSALFEAVKEQRIEEVQTLLALPDCPINLPNGLNEETPLHLATALGNVEITKLLLQHDGVHVNAEDIRGLTPLAIANANGFSLISDLLLRAGADGEKTEEKKKKKIRLPIDWSASPTPPGDQARCTCCHTCRTSLSLYPREYKACSTCSYIVCKNCFDSKSYLGITWDQVKDEPVWSCGVCMGNCICGRCCTRGPPRWYGHKKGMKNPPFTKSDKSQDSQEETVTNVPPELPITPPFSEFKNSVDTKAKPRSTACHQCRKYLGQTPFKSCSTCPYVFCQECGEGERKGEEEGWSCKVCYGICECSRCTTTGHVMWYGQLKNDSGIIPPPSQEIGSPTGPPTPATLPSAPEERPMLDTIIQMKDQGFTDSMTRLDPGILDVQFTTSLGSMGDIRSSIGEDITALFKAEDFITASSRAQ